MSHHREKLARCARQSLLGSAIASCLLLSAPAFSQTASATLRGEVVANEAPVAGANVTATNTQTGLSRTVQTGPKGAYTLAGLPPGIYKVEARAEGGATARLVTLQVGQTATLDLGVAAVAQNVESVTVTATQLYEARTSEVATYISQRQIEALPQNSRNFLAFADIVPGVQFVTKGDGSAEIRSGAQASNGVNVFIDGVGQKNYVLRGGVSGQALSRGNPFPQLGIGEYKVITSNYKAEFDQLSSAAIVAVTRSGKNEFESEAFWDRTSENWRAADPIEARQGHKAASEQEQYGVAFGGPILRDRMHFFVTYEAKKFETPKTVRLGQGVSSADVGDFAQYLGVLSAPFDEDLFFGKIDWSVSDDHLLELTAKIREESEVQNVGDERAASFGSTKDNEETRIDLRYQYSGPQFLNDMHLTYEDASFNPRPLTIAPGYRLTTGVQTRVILSLGGGEDYQDKGQSGWALQDDLTFTAFEWLGAHTVKTGLKYKEVEINAFEQQPYNPQFFYDINGDLTMPYRVEFGAALPGLPERNVKSSNKQFGIYLQDDWEVSERLLVNLGVRWDYEETPSYLDFVTPAEVLAGLNAVDPAADPALNQTYAQTLALGGIDINDYISTGNNRDAFKGAIQPRVGFSYDLSEDERSVLFGGYGRAYDRNVFDYMSLERSKGTFPRYVRQFDIPGHECAGAGDCIPWDPAYFEPQNLQALIAANPQRGREIDLINNDLKTPYSDQFSLGIRNRLELWGQEWNTSTTLSYIESQDGIVFLLGNRYPDGSFRDIPGTIWGGQPWGNGIPGLGALIIAKNGLETHAKQVLLQAEKPYSSDSGWSVTLAYTFTDAQENRTNSGFNDEHAIFDYPDVAGFGWHASTGVPKHRLVATGIWDAPWELTASAKLTLQSPTEYEALNCLDTVGLTPPDRFCRFQNFKPDTTFGLRQLDLALQKGWQTWSDLRIKLRADVLNVFNYENVDTYDVFRGNNGVANPAFGNATAYRQPTRTFKLSFSVDWR
jgi:outer membrane receptor protein involved in Fe transport